MVVAFVGAVCHLFRRGAQYANMQPPCNTATTSASASWPASPAEAVRLNEHLARSRSRLAAPVDTSKTHLFIGNEGADLDSIVSSMLLAYASEASGMKGCASVINCARADLHLRADAALALAAAGIDVERLVFVDEVDGIGSIPTVTLVDHNEPAPHQKGLSGNVRGVVDHHADADLFPDAEPRLIELVGSCATLVAGLHPGLYAGPASDRAAASLLLAAMLIDTRNCAGGTLRDKHAADTLAQGLGMNGDSRERLFNLLQEAKMAQGHLSTSDLLRRDYKQFEGGGKLVGISSCGLGFMDWSTRNSGPSFALTFDLLQSWAGSQHIDVLIVMTNFAGAEGRCRELLVCAASDENEDMAKYDAPHTLTIISVLPSLHL